MRTARASRILAVAAALTATAGAAGQVDLPWSRGAYVPLFNGKDLSGWHNVNGGPETWSVRDGMIACTGVPICVLRTEKQYENFELDLEWRHLKAGGNSGVFVWSDPLPAKGQPYTRGIEVQVLDGQEGSWYTSDGDVFPIHGASMAPDNGRGGSRAFPTAKRVKPAPAWNRYHITCFNGAITLAVNGEIVTSGSQCRPRRGYVCLESEGSPVNFRNLRIRELPASPRPPAPEEVAEAARGFHALYTGVDLSGWRADPDHEGHWVPRDWRLAFDGQGSDLWSEGSYRDFVLRCDWRWTDPPRPTPRPVILPTGEYQRDAAGQVVKLEVSDAGDSGIYLRGSSKSQVNMWCWPAGSGEVYGYRTDPTMPPAVRAAATPCARADAPIGEWNRFIITMQGERLTVVLNGQRVIDRARLPGVPARGPIALQHHGGGLEFANIFIRALEPAEPAAAPRGEEGREGPSGTVQRPGRVVGRRGGMPGRGRSRPGR